MKDKEIQLERLMTEKLTGVIGEDDDQYLEGLLLKDEDVQQQWEQIKQNYEESTPHQYLQNIDTRTAWIQVKQGISERKERWRIKKRRWAVAASLMIPLLLAGWFFISKNTQDTDYRIAQNQKQVNGVKLLVNGSSAINLSQYKKHAQIHSIKNVNLQVNNGNLSFKTINNQVESALNTLKVPTTKTYTIVLSDGTEVSLNSMSQLKFPFTFTGKKREVWLSGEAYFKVATDADRPFIVHTSKTSVKVLGTVFNINAYDSAHIRTSLVSGSVRTVAPDGDGILLKPGYEASFIPDKGFDIHAFDATRTLSWMHGVYYFENSRLKDIAAVIRRWYGKSVAFDNTKVANNRFTGALVKRQSLKTFLENLKTTSNIQYYNGKGKIHIAMK